PDRDADGVRPTTGAAPRSLRQSPVSDRWDQQGGVERRAHRDATRFDQRRGARRFEYASAKRRRAGYQALIPSSYFQAPRRSRVRVRRKERPKSGERIQASASGLATW